MKKPYIEPTPPPPAKSALNPEPCKTCVNAREVYDRSDFDRDPRWRPCPDCTGKPRESGK